MPSAKRAIVVLTCCAAAAAACGTSSSTEGAAVVDGGASDAGTRGDEDAASSDAGADDAAWAIAPHDPFPQVPDHGGAVLAHVELVTVTFSGYAFADDVEAFGDWLVGSQWLADVGRDYGVGNGTHAAKVRLAASTAVPATDADLRALLANLVSAGTVPAPTASTLYTVYLPPGTAFTAGSLGTDCKDYSGYHSEPRTGTDYAYALVGACDGYVSGLSLLENVERTASHEIIEAATDPHVALGRAYVLDDFTNAWAVPEGEVADICRLGWTVRDGAFLAQRVWSNTAAKAGTFPCVPAPSGAPPYRNVSVSPSGTVLVDPGQTLTLTVRGWSSAPVPDWVIHVPSASVGDFSAAAALSATTIGNGKEVTLTLSVPASAPTGKRSYLRIASAATTSGLPLGDYWPVAIQAR